MTKWLSLRFFPITVLVFITLATDLPTATSRTRISDEHINNAIRRAVNDGFTITKDDKEFFENIIRDEYSSNTESGGVIEDPRIVDGEEAALGRFLHRAFILIIEKRIIILKLLTLLRHICFHYHRCIAISMCSTI